jgi:hypothetical protein
MTTYRCPVCGNTVDERLRFLHAETERWLIARVKRQHPEWVAEDGACPRCVETYRARRGGSAGGPAGERPGEVE